MKQTLLMNLIQKNLVNIYINNNTTIKYIFNGSNEANTCYGKRIISSKSKNKYIWKIKLIQGYGEINIGIDDAKAINCNENIYVKRNEREGLYGFYCKSGYAFAWNSYHNHLGYPQFKKPEDILIITLDLRSEKSKLIFKINKNGRKFVLFENILRRKGLYYRLAITMFHDEEILQLVP